MVMTANDAMIARLNYVELPVGDVGVAAAFYTAAFGWPTTTFGPTYAATTGQHGDVGLQGDAAEAPTAPLPVIEADDLDAAQTAVADAGGTIIRAIFAYPGGQRFHFRVPSGNELAVYRPDR